MASYLQQNPEQVTSESYFNKLFDKESGWRGICRKADDFFEKQNKEKRKKSRAEIIAESRSDLELIKEYPAENLILVRLKTPEALDYEGSAAHNCVGGGSYDKLIGKRDSGIYSLRQLMPDGELKPVVTIELNEGQMKQIRGVCNSFVAYNYSLPARDAALLLLNKKTQAELVLDKNISENVLNAFGLFRDGKGGYLDIHNLTGAEDFELPELRITADGLKDYDWEKLKIKDVCILGKLQDSEACSYLEHLTKAQRITIEDLAVSLNLDLDKFNRLQKLNISSAEGADCCLHGQKSVLSELSLSKISLKQSDNIRLACLNLRDVAFEEMDLRYFSELEKISLNKTDLSRTDLKLPADIQLICEDCILNEKTVLQCLSTPQRGRAYNAVYGTHFDFSEYSEYLNLDGLHFHEVKVMKFAPHIKTLLLDTQVPSSVKIEGLNEVENVILYLNSWNKLIMEKINPQTIKNLDINNIFIQDSEFDISRCTNLKELSGSGLAIDKIPQSVEKLKTNDLFSTKAEKTDTWDFSRLPNLRDLDINESGYIKHIIFPPNVERLKLGHIFWEIEALDLKHCHRLNEIKLTLIAPKIKKVSLPDCVKVLEASHAESGIGVKSNGFEKNTDLRIEVPSTARPEIIGYLREQWGNDRINIIPPEKKANCAGFVIAKPK